MDRLSRITNIIRWQELYQDKKHIVSQYEENEISLNQMSEEYNQALAHQQKLEEFRASLAEKISTEEQRLDFILTQIDTMEKDRDNLKMSRQIKSWEKDMERYSQDRAMMESQVYYDKSKIGDIEQELEVLNGQLAESKEKIEVLSAEINAVKSATATEREQIEKEILEITSKFDAHFVEYFDRLLVKNRGIVMAEIEEDSCSGCNVLLPTSYHGGDVSQDAEDSALLQCPNCFRYLYYGEDL